MPDIAKVISGDVKILRLVNDYCEKNNETDQDELFESIEMLRGIINNHIGLIELNSDLDIETVTEIFIRINSQGVVLSQADFAMSKIAVNETYGGNRLRKCIDYFCHLAVAPEFYERLKKLDQEFSESEYFRKMSWLKTENDDLYDPKYTDMLRVAFTSQFKRGRLEDLVALLSGRNFETRDYEEKIVEQSYQLLEKGLMRFMQETEFKRFVMILNSAGFIESSLIRSQNTINFAYIVYIVLRDLKMDTGPIESYVKKWFVMSILTGRYSGSPESAFDQDIRRINELGIEKCLNDIEKGELSEAFWTSSLPLQMNTSVASSPYFNLYLAAQVCDNDKGFLSKDITVRELITHKGDVHHLFPKNYLKKNGLTRGKYNQIANYVIMQSEINIAIGDKSPSSYFKKLLDHCNSGKKAYGAISDLNQMKANFAMHCIPDGMEDKNIEHYEAFLETRRKLMAEKIKNYYARL